MVKWTLDAYFLPVKGIFQCKFNPWSKTPWHCKTPPQKGSSLQTTGLLSVRNLRNDRTITIHCGLHLQQETAVSEVRCCSEHYLWLFDGIPLSDHRSWSIRIFFRPHFFFEDTGSPLSFQFFIMRWTALNLILVVSAVSLDVFSAWCMPMTWPLSKRSFPRPWDVSFNIVV